MELAWASDSELVSATVLASVKESELAWPSELASALQLALLSVSGLGVECANPTSESCA